MIIPLGYAHVIHVFSGTGLPEGAAVTYGVDLPNVLDPEVAAEALHDAFGDEMLGALSSTAQLETTRVKFGPNDTGGFGEFTSVRAGLSSDAQAPPNVALLVRKPTALGGRKNRGRFYLPGIPETAVGANGVIASGNVTTYQGYATAFYDRLVIEGYEPVILHNAAGAPTAITAFTVDQKVATQRRRLR